MPHSEAVRKLVAAAKRDAIRIQAIAEDLHSSNVVVEVEMAHGLFSVAKSLRRLAKAVKAEEKPQTHPGIPEHVAPVHQIGGK